VTAYVLCHHHDSMCSCMLVSVAVLLAGVSHSRVEGPSTRCVTFKRFDVDSTVHSVSPWG
jgi:hypothetical protein